MLVRNRYLYDVSTWMGMLEMAQSDPCAHMVLVQLHLSAKRKANESKELTVGLIPF